MDEARNGVMMPLTAITVPGFLSVHEQGSLLGAPIDSAPPIRVAILAPPQAPPFAPSCFHSASTGAMET
jgi:hypothetical protein